MVANNGILIHIDINQKDCSNSSQGLSFLIEGSLQDQTLMFW